MRLLLPVIAAGLMFFGFVGGVQAQTARGDAASFDSPVITGRVYGTVSSADGMRAVRVRVLMINLNTLESRVTVTNQNGVFAFEQVTFGDHFMISVYGKRYAANGVFRFFQLTNDELFIDLPIYEAL